MIPLPSTVPEHGEVLGSAAQALRVLAVVYACPLRCCRWLRKLDALPCTLDIRKLRKSEDGSYS